ncbi:two-component sensor histidine kinase [Chryseobacterium contaminans]|uniref:histidine kinase n=1 Tax=Chryseobacterium contaminans TaxID=1423959 RepID=A0A1M6WKA5_9FLAO|nr:histidine kinase [Chryseobacterium contaminans]OCA78429.1 two-component sensor histidine kinase [Chryseobacterium contaminans]SHK94046.1 two-component system, NarL family, sensor histidine kinase DesK [Chryseobacterium contaminans]
MKQLPDAIRLTYIIAAILLIIFVVFIVLIIILYNKRQIFFIQQQRLKEAEHQNQLLQKELEQQRSIEKERERISHDMHDDLGAGISALKLQAEFLKYKIEDNELQNDIDELLRTSEEMNISMREMLWSLNSGNDTLGSFIEYAILYTGNFLKKTKIIFHSECEDIISDTSISTELRRNLFLCLKEAVNNVYKHSKANVLKLSFCQIGNHFLMRIEDDGIGIPGGKLEGNGLRNMKRRMKEVQGECKISSATSKTILTFEIIQ